MKFNDLIKIRKAKKMDAKAPNITPKSYYEEIEKLFTLIRDADSLKALDKVVDEICLFSQRDFSYSRLVNKALENVYYQKHDYRTSPALDLQLLNFMRTYSLSLQKKKEVSESFQLFRKKYQQWRKGKISREQLLDSSKKYLGGIYAS